MCRTWRQAAEIFDFQLNVSAPPGYELKGRSRNCKSFADPMEAARGAHLVTTDVWTSMGFEAENQKRKKVFADWQVSPAMMKGARQDALFMHCLPAHRGEEVSAKVIDGKQSVGWAEAEDRLHTQQSRSAGDPPPHPEGADGVPAAGESKRQREIAQAGAPLRAP